MSSFLEKGILKNFGYLTVIQLFNLIFPIIIYPYIIKTVGTENYGLVLFAQSIIIYFSLVVNFGFTVYGTNEVSTSNNNKANLSRIITDILMIQLILICLTFLVIGIISVFLDADTSLLLMLATYLCLNELAIPTWYFQGRQQMKYIAICNFLAKLTSLIVIVFMVKGPNDYHFILVAYLLGTLICGIFSWNKILIIDKNKLSKWSFKSLKNVIAESTPFFVSHSLGGITGKSNGFVIGKFVGTTELAYYDLAEKLINLVSVIFSNFSNAIFPVMSQKRNKNLVKNSLKIVLIISVLAILFLNLFAGDIITIIGGSSMKPAIPYLCFLSISLIPKSIGPIISTSILAVNNLGFVLSRSFILGFISYTILISALIIFNYSTVVTIIAVYLSALFITISYRIYFCYKNKLKSWII
ncbi:oligosaccharide flippase family protein [Maribacter dokdonensis]|uniref:oligosaccharide flippase family protein n=1 Tax=Maribacter dokdonensis TaxID=320912 RepID=UPI001C084CD7|nr:oligosaccharide flippase family protein [Maribacter dokdonensis]MBU2900557.1 oligosaccharide flippase family protein [Maribacter dokdonensis]